MQKTLDVRTLPPGNKHLTIFQTFDALEVGSSILLVNDHDPIPLRHQFEQQRSGQFSWDYEEKGPKEFRVRISKNSNGDKDDGGSCCGCCGSH